MNSNELRRGNLIYDKLGRVVKIDEIREDTYTTRLSNKRKLKYHYHTSNPIPVTEERLNKLGFKQQIGFSIDTLSGILVVAHNDMDRWYVFFQNLNKGEFPDCTTLRNDLRYIHQLQNIYYVLNSTELPTPTNF